MKFFVSSIAFTLAFGYTMGSKTSIKRKLTIDRIAGYMPTSDVTDQLMLDLDQYNIEEQLMQRKLNIAKRIYEYGGHSQSFAVLTLDAPNGTFGYQAGSSVWAKNDAGDLIKGTLLDDAVWEGSVSQDVNITVSYDKDQGYDNCQVGALYLFKSALLNNCFTASGTVRIAPPGRPNYDDGKDFSYRYNIRTDNRNGQSIKQLTVLAGSLMHAPSGEYFDDFNTFVKFYGQPDYADRWITAAVDKTSTDFRSGLGNANFAELIGRDGQGEAMAKGTVFLAVYMYIIGRLEESVVNCVIGCYDENCKAKATHTLDEAVAYYAGSLVDYSVDNTTGVFFYALAENRAHNFKTAGHQPIKDSGEAYVNIHVFNHFKTMQSALQGGTADSCKSAIESKNEIIRLMKIPLVQSVLGYAYIRDRDELTNDDEIEKVEAKGATYVASIIPYIHECNPKNAEILYNQMRIGSEMSNVNYHEIRHAFETSYECLNITCSEVGGIWSGSEYLTDASPCGIESKKSAGWVYAASFLIVFGFAGIAFFLIRRRRRRSRYSNDEVISLGNISAVSEIA